MDEPNRITLLRTMQKWEALDVATRLGIRERRVIRWETGQTSIPDEWKLKLAELFGVSVPFLMGWPDIRNDNDRDIPVAAA